MGIVLVPLARRAVRLGGWGKGIEAKRVRRQSPVRLVLGIALAVAF